MERKGCTANVLLIYDGTLICANAGDSRCLVAEGGVAIPLSKDHKPANKKERERIRNAGLRVDHDGRIDGTLNLSRAIGDVYHKKNKKLEFNE
jgi:serine/threonine protein phosphatase PrpC